MTLDCYILMLLQSNTKVPNRNLCVLTNELTKHKATHLADLILKAELLALPWQQTAGSSWLLQPDPSRLTAARL